MSQFDWRIGDRFEVQGSLFVDPTLTHPGSYAWGSDNRIVPKEGQRGTVVALRNTGALGVDFDGEHASDGPYPGWSVRLVVFRHFLQIDERLHCAACGARCEGLDYLCGSCRT